MSCQSQRTSIHLPQRILEMKIPYPLVHVFIVHIYTYNIRKNISAPIQMTEISLVLLILTFLYINDQKLKIYARIAVRN
jgi:hypothetical protein